MGRVQVSLAHSLALDNKNASLTSMLCRRAKALQATTEYSFRWPYHWEAIHEVEAEASDSSVSIPHLIFRVVNHTDCHESLARGEVIAIAAYMEWRLKQRVLWEHYYCPVSTA
ncbi:uncharacterized protein BDV17DRAFT_256378 [Aspergillus undulatus]|uniref:uncharacterized protein n=1 Tax=Aspergillus undulatus TaxID=1810928 RepID=UPI003CCDBE21